MRILLVEDEEGQYMTFINVLEDINLPDTIDLSWARNDNAALKKVEGSSFDLIFMDISLKGSVLDGIELTRHFREKLCIETPIIAYSISRKPDDESKVLEAGANIFFPKPFDYEDLITEMRKLILNVKAGINFAKK